MKLHSLVTVLSRPGHHPVIIVPLWIILLRHPDYSHWPPKILEAAVNGKAVKK